MRFGAIALAEAEGAILAHSHRLAGGTFKKGRVLSAEDVARLAKAGYDSVVAAQLDREDVGEDDAASTLALACLGPGVTASAAFTGRCNLFAEEAGVLVVDRERIDRINLVDESLTIATVEPFSLVGPRDMLATIKVIPFAVPRTVLETCVDIAEEEAPLFRVAALRRLTGALIMTSTEGMKPSILDRTETATRERLTALGGGLPERNVVRCGHTEDEVATAIAHMLDAGADIIMVSGASAIVDRRDVIPAAMVRAGGTIDHFGMPVDPGNLILLAHIGEVPMLGLPGCARSPALNGYDWVLRRLFAGLPVGPEEIMRMGVGGLLKEISSRPLPRAKAVAGEGREKAPARAPRVAAVVLAAGQSRRMGSVNKLLADLDGAPMVRRVVEAVRASKARPIVVVLGHEADRVEQAVGAARDVTFVRNPDYAAGLSTSLKRGLAALGEDVDGAVVCLGDMPGITAAHLDRLIAAFDPVEGRAICVPTFNGKRGNPVLWDRRFFAEMADVAGDVGARHLIGTHAESVCEVAMADPGVLLDLDTPDALAAHRAERARRA